MCSSDLLAILPEDRDCLIQKGVAERRLSAIQAQAKKSSCPDGWTAGERGLCYSVDRVGNELGGLSIMGQVRLARSHKIVVLAAAVYKDRRVVATCITTLQNAEKDVEMAFNMPFCQGETEIEPDRVVVRIDSTL